MLQMSFDGEQDLVNRMNELVVNRRWKQSHGYQMRQNYCDQMTNYKKVNFRYLDPSRHDS